MKTRSIQRTSLLISFLALSIVAAQAQTIDWPANDATSPTARKSEFQLYGLLAQSRPGSRSGFNLRPSGSTVRDRAPLFSITPLAGGPSLPLLGGGTIGRLTKWTGFTSSNSFVGDTTIFEDKFGMVGIGTDAPTTKLTVAGTIQSLSGGFKFPDGTIQTTAGIAPSQVVRTLNGLMGDVTLAAGANITITPAGNTLTIAAPNALASIAHDATLRGNGITASPLGVAVPLFLSGSGTALIFQATNTTVSGDGMRGEGGRGGNGVDAMGGDNDSDTAGTGLLAQGGGASNDFSGGAGVSATGGNSDSGTGGNGVAAMGGTGSGAGHRGGDGIAAVGGAGVGAPSGLAGFFNGDVQVTGNLSKGGGSFKIDHPLDPENKYLYHSFVESPDMKNIYDGVVKLDLHGEAVVELPEWFDALNRDFRYLLTAIGAPAPNLFIAEKVSNNRFKIAGGLSGMEVSWQVTGIRQDAYANKHRIPVEADKPEGERGTYIHPDAFNQPDERSVGWARHPEIMQRLNQRRIEAEQTFKRQPH